MTLVVGLMLSVSGSAWGNNPSGNYSQYSDEVVCLEAARFSKRLNKNVWTAYGWRGIEARLAAYKRGLSCGVNEPDKVLIEKRFVPVDYAGKIAEPSSSFSDLHICHVATKDSKWDYDFEKYIVEAKRRGLSCGVGESGATQVATTSANTSGLPACPSDRGYWHNCFGTYTSSSGNKYVGEYRDNKRNGQFTVTYANGNKYVGEYRDNKRNGQGTSTFPNGNKYVGEYRDSKRNGQGTFTFADGTKYEGVWKDNKFQYAKKLIPSTATTVGETASAVQGSGVSPTALTAAQQKAEEERQKRLEAEAELAALKAQQEQRQQTITNDNQIPLIEISSQQKDEATALVYGRATDNVGLADVQVNNELVQVGSDGSFQTQLYIPPNGLVVEITAYDLRGNKATKTLSLARNRAEDAAEARFAQLQPSLGKRGAINRDAIALIVGVEKYENLPAAPAIHADKDAEYFADFAHYKLGIQRNNIITAINSDAKRLDILKAITKVTKLSTKDKTEVFIFFAGHGLAATDGQDVFLLPYDGDKDYLDATAMTRDEIFQLVERIEPKSVTVFLDACYTGGTRSQDITLVAGKRPVRVEALNQSVPKGFTILSASASDETSMALEAAEHGMFSYFLMKGMEGDADADNDNQITMAEMRDYVKDKVVRQSNFKQTPELQGDADRVLVRFQ